MKQLLKKLRQRTKDTIGFSKLSKKTNLARESLYKSLSKNGDPYFSSILKICKTLDLKISIRSDED